MIPSPVFYLHSAEVLHFYKWGMNANSTSIQWGFKPRLNEVKPPADVTDFLGVIYPSELR